MKKKSLKSFRLPTDGPSGEYQTLYNNYNSWTAMTDPSGPQFVLGGRTEPGSSPLYQGTLGFYWSSSAHTNATFAYILYLIGTNSTVVPARDDYKLFGFSLRCLAQ